MKRLGRSLGLLFVLAACGGPKGNLHVVAVAPAGDVSAEDVAKGIKVTFDRPMVAEAEVGKDVATPPITVTPAIEGKARWLDRQTLVFMPAGPLEPSTRYTVAVRPETRALDGERLAEVKSGVFVHERLRVVHHGFADPRERFQTPTPQVVLEFNHPVSEADAAAACRFAPDGAGAAVESEAGDPQSAPVRSIRLRPRAVLARGTKYNLRCAATLSPRPGAEGLGAVYEAPFSTYGPLLVLGFKPEGDAVSPDQTPFEITFATPVPADEVARNVTVSPEVAGLAFLGESEDRHTARVELDPDVAYTVTVKKGLKDEFGQTLANDAVYQFTTGDARPRLNYPGGVSVVESRTGKLPVFTRNLTRMDVKCVAVPEATLPGVLATDVRWGEWPEREGEPSKLAELKLTPASQRVALAGTPNKWFDASIDLAATCGASKDRLYLLTIDSDEIPRDSFWRRGALVNVTDLGVLAKVGTASSLVWVVKLSTGQPVAGARVKVRDMKGKIIARATSGADGTAALPGVQGLTGAPRDSGDPEEMWEEFESSSARRVILSVDAGGDRAVLDTEWQNGIETWSFARTEYAGAEKTVRGFLQSDRGLYRPGDTVHLRGLVRIVEASGRMGLPSGGPVKLRVEDPRGTVVLEGDVDVSRFGGFHADVNLSAEARLGDYRVQGQIAGQTFRETFSVEEYRPRTFEVKLTRAERTLVRGEPIEVDIAGNYLYGAPLSGGEVTWNVRRRRHTPSFEGLGEYTFHDSATFWDDYSGYWDGEDRSFTDFVADGTLTLDDQGAAHLRTQDDETAPAGARDYLVSATVTDASGQSATQTSLLVAHPAHVYLGVRVRDYVPTAGKPAPVEIVAVRPDGARRAADAKLTVKRVVWNCGDRTGWWQCERKETVALEKDVQIGEGAPAVVDLVHAQPGEHRIFVKAGDGQGHEALASETVWVVGAGGGYWKRDDSAKISIVKNQARFKPGETARLVPQADMPNALALVTVERNGVMKQWTTRLAPGAGIDVPIEEGYAPNVYASIVLVQGRTGAGDKARPRLAMGVAQLEIDTTARRLQIGVETDRPSYRPGETVTATVKVTDAGGAPVQAEVALAAADEGVLQILGYRTPDPMATFYKAWGLGVDASTSFGHIVREARPDLVEDDGGGDAGGGEAGRIRSRFMATAFWNPALVTDGAGTARVTFTAPDNLTAFRVMAVAADDGDRFGSGDKRFTVAKPLQAMPALPRLLRVGDRVQAGVVIHNNTPGAGKVVVEAEAEGVTLAEKRREVEVPAGGKTAVLFPVEVAGAGQATFRFRATLGPERDAVEVTLPVERPERVDLVAVGEGQTEGALELPVSVTGDLYRDRGGLELVLDTTGLASLDESVRYLIGYPYGCLEQTTSKVVPMVAVGDLVEQLGIAGVDQGKLRGFVEAGLAKVVRHQHRGGGFGLWPDSSPEVYLTAFALYGLSVAQKAGYSVDAKVIADGAEYLHTSLEGEPTSRHGGDLHGAWGDRAFALWVMGEVGRPDAGLAAKLFERRAGLPMYGKAYLARALKRAKLGQQATLVLDEVKATVRAGSGPVLVTEGGGEWQWWYMSSDVRSTAAVLSALLELQPKDPLIDRLAAGLLKERSSGRWDTTQDNVYSLVSLAQLARARARGEAAKVEVSLGGKTLLATTLSGANVRRLHIPAAELASGALSLKTSGRPIHYAARLRLHRPLAEKAESQGLTVEREYLDPVSGKKLDTIRVGQTVRVRVKIHADADQAFVAVVDPLPAGLEPVLERLSSGEEEWEEEWDGEATSWAYREMRDDEVAIFSDHVYPGEAIHEYLAQAVTSGTFVAPPPRAEAMYRPEIRGRGASTPLTISR